jgi:hypothetical protein
MVYEGVGSGEWVVMGNKYILKPGEKVFNDWNPIFLNPNSICMWMLIVDGIPMMRTESIHMMDDEKVQFLSDNGWEIWRSDE